MKMALVTLLATVSENLYFAVHISHIKHLFRLQLLQALDTIATTKFVQKVSVLKMLPSHEGNNKLGKTVTGCNVSRRTRTGLRLLQVPVRY